MAFTYKFVTPKYADLLLAATFIVLWLAYLLMQLPERTILVPDSISYINFYSIRTAGYPLFLMITGVEAAKIIQPVLAALSLFILYWECRKLFSENRLLAIAIIIAIGVNSRFFHYHYTIFTESLYVSLLMLVVATYIRFVRMPSDKFTLALLSTLCGLCVTIRPSAIFLLPAILIGIMLVWQSSKVSRVKLVTICVLPFLTILYTEKIFNDKWHDGQSTSLFYRHAFAKAALISSPAIDDNSKYERALEYNFESARQFIWSAPGFYTRNHFLTHYEICIQYSCSTDQGLDLDSGDAYQAALKRIRSNISGYFYLTWHNYRSLWVVYPTSTPGLASKINNYLVNNRPIPFSTQLSWLNAQIQPLGKLKLIIQIIVLLIGLASICIISLGLYNWLRKRYLEPVFAVTVFVSLCIQGSQLLTALTGVSVIRYTISLWPLFIVCLAGISSWLLTKNRS